MLLSLLFVLWLFSPTWTVHVVASGGFSGGVNQELTISADGKIECVIPRTPCPEQPDVTKLTSLIESLPAEGVFVIQPEPPDFLCTDCFLCNDCLTRTIVIRRSDSTGMVKSYSAQWNDVTKSSVPPQILQIYDAVIALQKQIAR